VSKRWQNNNFITLCTVC